MTEKIRKTFENRGWELLMSSMLVVIIGMGGWYIDRLTDIQDRQEERMKVQENDLDNIAYILDKCTWISETDHIELRKIYFKSRGK